MLHLGKSLAASLAVGSTLVFTIPAQALVPGGGGGGGGSTSRPSDGPSPSYISGRLGGARQSPSAAPTGTVVPDDFCLPGKLDDCGDHLREEAPIPFVDTPIFVGGEDLAFFEAKNSAWISGVYRQVSDSALSEIQTSSSFSLGADHRFGERLVLGVTANANQSTTDFTAAGYEDQASGFSAGPYFAYRLSETVFLDGRFLFGTADHEILTGGAQTGSFQSTESFAALRLSADIERNNWSIYPSLEFAQIRSDDPAYTDTIRGAIAASNTTQTFITAAALGYYNGIEGMTPYIGAELSQETNGGSPFGTLRAGVTFAFDNGAELNIDYAYGAIGLNNVDDQQVSFRFEIPF